MKELHAEPARDKKKKVEHEIREIWVAKDNSNRMLKAIKNLQRMKVKTPLMIDSEGGTTTDPENQTDIISEFFEKMFTDANVKEIENVPPTEMRIPFTEDEIRSAVKV